MKLNFSSSNKDFKVLALLFLVCYHCMTFSTSVLLSTMGTWWHASEKHLFSQHCNAHICDFIWFLRPLEKMGIRVWVTSVGEEMLRPMELRKEPGGQSQSLQGWLMENNELMLWKASTLTSQMCHPLSQMFKTQSLLWFSSEIVAT